MTSYPSPPPPAGAPTASGQPVTEQEGQGALVYSPSSPDTWDPRGLSL